MNTNFTPSRGKSRQPWMTIHEARAKKDQAYQLLRQKKMDEALAIFVEVRDSFRAQGTIDIVAEIGVAECHLQKKETDQIIKDLENQEVEQGLNEIKDDTKTLYKYKVYKMLLIAYFDLYTKSEPKKNTLLKTARLYADRMLANTSCKMDSHEIVVKLPKNIKLDERACIVYLRLLDWEKRSDEAITLINHILVEHPDNFEFIFQKVKLLFYKFEKRNEATNLLFDFYLKIRSNQSNEVIRQILQIAYFMLRSTTDFQKAEQIITDVLQIQPGNARALKFQQELSLRRSYEYKPNLTQIAQDLVSQNAQAAEHTAIEKAKKLVQDPANRKLAFQILELVIKHRPQAEKAYYSLMHIYQDDDNTPKLRDLTQEYLQRFDDAVPSQMLFVLSVMGDCAEKLKDNRLITLAIENCKKLCGKHCDYQPARFGYIRLLKLRMEIRGVQQSDWNQVESEYKSILDKDKTVWRAIKGLANAYFEQERDDEVIALCSVVHQYQGNIGKGRHSPSAHETAIIYNYLAMAYRRKLDLVQAEKYALKGVNLVEGKISQAASVAADDPVLYFSGAHSTLGHIYYDMCKKEMGHESHSLAAKSRAFHDRAEQINPVKFVEKRNRSERAKSVRHISSIAAPDDKLYSYYSRAFEDEACAVQTDTKNLVSKLPENKDSKIEQTRGVGQKKFTAYKKRFKALVGTCTKLQDIFKDALSEKDNRKFNEHLATISNFENSSAAINAVVHALKEIFKILFFAGKKTAKLNDEKENEQHYTMLKSEFGKMSNDSSAEYTVQLESVVKHWETAFTALGEKAGIIPKAVLIEPTKDEGLNPICVSVPIPASNHVLPDEKSGVDMQAPVVDQEAKSETNNVSPEADTRNEIQKQFKETKTAYSRRCLFLSGTAGIVTAVVAAGAVYLQLNRCSIV